MTSHELANALLKLPDVPVVGMMVGQGGNEGQDEDLTRVILSGDEPDEFKNNNWLVESGKIGLYF